MRDFTKIPLTIEKQLALLQSRGLIVNDEEKAKIYLSNISYYRLSAYWYTFLVKPQNEHKFAPNSHFNDVINTYIFDRKLRFLLFEELERIEIAIRTQLVYHFCLNHGNNWYEDKSLFKKSNYYYKFNELIQSEIARTNEVFIRHYKSTYNNPENPPAWMILELASFGQISMLFKNLRNNNPSKLAVSEHFGLTDVVLESWLESLSYIRNSCAHHMRLWNRKLPKRPLVPQKTKFEWINSIPEQHEQNKMYLTLCSVQYLLKSFIPNSNFGSKLKELINTYPNIPLHYMGFTKNWHSETLWQ